jgi:hypothetical protein
MSDSTSHHLTELQALEVELHKPAARGNHARLNTVLHADYLEFGRSGQCYTKAEVLDVFPLETNPANIWADNFELRMLGAETALLTYLSWQVLSDGTHERHTLRTSIWQLTEQGWQMRFHQGTPTQTLPRIE